MEQTPVEWLEKELDKRHCVVLNYPEYQELINQAKQMENEKLESLKDFDNWKEWKNS